MVSLGLSLHGSGRGRTRLVFNLTGPFWALRLGILPHSCITQQHVRTSTGRQHDKRGTVTLCTICHGRFRGLAWLGLSYCGSTVQAEDMVAATLGGAAMQTNHLYASQSNGQASPQRAAEDMRSELAGLKAELDAGLDARIAAALQDHAKVRNTANGNSMTPHLTARSLVNTLQTPNTFTASTSRHCNVS